MARMPRNTASSASTAPRRATAASWKPGQSGNPHGRPPAPVDIAALARVHGPRCIEVAVELLDSPDDRIRLGAVVALLDRGYGRPATVIATPDGNSAPTLHLLAAMQISPQLEAQRERYAINGTTGPGNGLSAPPTE